MKRFFHNIQIAKIKNTFAHARRVFFATYKKRKRVFALVFISFFLIAGVGIYFQFAAKKAAAAWWNDAWNYRRIMQVTNSSGGDLSNQRVKIVFDTATMIAANKMQSNCNDIRVTDINGTVLDSWDVACNTASTNIYVKMQKLPVQGTTLYLYYGNATAQGIEKKLGSTESPGTSCRMMKNQGSVTTNGTYYIAPTGNDADLMQVFCDVTTLSDGWTMVLNSNRSVANPKPNWSDAVNSMNLTGTFGSDLNAFDLILGLKYWNNIGDSMLVEIGSSAQTITKRAVYLNTSLNAGNNYALSLGAETLFLGATTPGIKSYHAANSFQFSTYDADHDTHGSNCSAMMGNSPWWYGACWSGSFWGGGDSGGYQDAPFWDGAGADFNDHAAIMLGGADSMQNVPIVAPWVNEEVTPGPIAYWKMDEGTGNVVNDSMSASNNGAIANAIWKDESQCVSGKCLYFDGTTSTTTFGTLANIPMTGDLTISYWMKPTNMTKGRQNPISKAYGGEFTFTLEPAGSLSYFHGSAGGNTTPYMAGSVPSMVNDKWMHIEAVRNNSTKVITFYVDGKYASQATWTTENPSYSSDTLKFGYGYAGYFQGYLDEVKIYAAVRSADQVKQDYNAGLSGASSANGSSTSFGVSSQKFMTDGLLGYWKMDETLWNGTAGEVKDASGNNNNGAAVNGALTSAGKFGNGGLFDGINDGINVGTVSPATAATFSSWVYINSTNVDFGTIFGNWGVGGNAYYIGTAPGTPSTIKVYFNTAFVYDVTNVPVNSWAHLVVTHDGTTASTYINGVLVKSQASTLIASTGVTGIGYDVGRAGYPFNGKIDEARIYNRALSNDEVLKLFEYAPSPVGYWKLDENTGTTANDSSGNGNTGTLVSSPAWTVGKNGSALNFNGTSNYVATTNNAFTQLTVGTVGAWVKTADSGAIGGVVVKVGAYGIFLVSNEVRLYDWTAGTWRSTGVFVNDNKWHYVATSFQSGVTNGTIVYVDGKNVLTTTITVLNQPSAFVIGAGGEGPGQVIAGSIDDVTLYNYIRSPKQISEDMNSGQSNANAQVGHWKFDEGNGNSANNAIANFSKYLGVKYNNTAWSSDGKFGNALSFNGNTDQVVIASSADLRYEGADFTMSAWVKPDATDDGGYIFSKPWNGSGGYNYWLVSSGGANPSFSVSVGGATSFTLGSIKTVTAGSWHHVGVTVNGASKLVSIYLDGKLASSGTHSISNWVPGIPDSNSNLVMGCIFPYGYDWCAGGTVYAYKGLIDEPKIFTSALSAQDMFAQYNQGFSVTMASAGISAGAGDNATKAQYCVPGDVSTCNSPIAEWNFDENTGNTAKDTSGNANNGTLVSTPTWSPGKTNAGLSFDGATQYVNMGDVLDMGTNSFTTNIWIKTTSTANTGIIGKSSARGLLGRYDTYIESGNLYALMEGTGYVIAPGIPFAQYANGKWHLITTVFDRTGNLSIYVDAVLKSSVSISAQSAIDMQSVDPFYIGQYGNASGTGPLAGWYFNGQMDNAKVYSYARTQAQIAYDYNRGKPIGWWKMDECQGSSLFDSSGNGNTGTLTIGATGSQTAIGTCETAGSAWLNGKTGKYSSSMNFDGTDDYIELQTTVPINISADFSVALWAKSNNWVGVQQLFGNVVSTSNRVGIKSNGAFLMGQIYNGASWVGASMSAATLSNNTWYHVVLTGNGGVLKMYLNGALQSGTNTYSSTGGGLKARIGGHVDSATLEPFNGQIDDVRVYNYTLTKEQVANVMNEGSALRFGN
jgi:hypothetical protein